jgi:hypothetical protein
MATPSSSLGDATVVASEVASGRKDRNVRLRELQSMEYNDATFYLYRL